MQALWEQLAYAWGDNKNVSLLKALSIDSARGALDYPWCAPPIGCDHCIKMVSRWFIQHSSEFEKFGIDLASIWHRIFLF